MCKFQNALPTTVSVTVHQSLTYFWSFNHLYTSSDYLKKWYYLSFPTTKKLYYITIMFLLCRRVICVLSFVSDWSTPSNHLPAQSQQ